MCCFSVPTPVGLLARLFARGRRAVTVSGTRIFARVDRAASTQWLAYAMAVDTPGDVAMVLPLPVARVADDALAFVDLSKAPELFDRLDDLFPSFELGEDVARAPRAKAMLARPQLVVHKVGS